MKFPEQGFLFTLIKNQLHFGAKARLLHNAQSSVVHDMDRTWTVDPRGERMVLRQQTWEH